MRYKRARGQKFLGAIIFELDPMRAALLFYGRGIHAGRDATVTNRFRMSFRRASLSRAGVTIAMTTKRQRVLGIVFASVASIFLLWHVDYLQPHVVGFEDNPLGDGSVAHRVLARLMDTSWNNAAINAAWTLTQVLPIALSWYARNTLGLAMGSVGRAVRRVYAMI
jgi:hypothetical protein